MANKSAHSVTIKPGTLILHVYKAKTVSGHTCCSETNLKFDARCLNFGNSALSKAWKEVLRQKLAQRADLLMQHEWFIRCDRGVEH